MRSYAVLLAVPLALATGCGSVARSPHAGVRTTPDASAVATKTTVAPTTLPIETVPTTASRGSAVPSASGKILMVKLYVGDLESAEKFYGTVFGAQLAIKLGHKAHIVTFAGGGPGLALIKAGPHDKNEKGSFIIQVPDLAAAKKLAVANGAKVQRAFAGNPAGQTAHSIDLLDPWGNGVEILQLG